MEMLPRYNISLKKDIDKHAILTERLDVNHCQITILWFSGFGHCIYGHVYKRDLEFLLKDVYSIVWVSFYIYLFTNKNSRRINVVYLYMAINSENR